MKIIHIVKFLFKIDEESKNSIFLSLFLFSFELSYDNQTSPLPSSVNVSFGNDLISCPNHSQPTNTSQLNDTRYILIMLKET